MAVIAATTLFGLPGSASAAPGVGSVSGNVVDELGSPLQNVCVMVENQSSTTTDSSGNFSITDLPEGQHRIQYSDCNDPRVYVTQWYLGAADESGAQYVDVVDSTDTPLSTVTMQPGVSVSGTVTDSGGSPIENIEVRLDPQGPYNSSSTMTDSNGDYRVGPVTDGQYDLTFEDTEYPQRYAAERWDDAYAEDSASTLDLMVTNGTELTGLDAQLAAASTISGNVQDESSNGLVDICVAGYLSEGGSSWWV
ncbi:MAG: carboxypeptidase regulatory-like domain-containing protein, partial [Microthrixaceae bacterium]|nr:carboxypeptidase regulatory-like domain-containing protein [Microthrixaceae bacterium]